MNKIKDFLYWRVFYNIKHGWQSYLGIVVHCDGEWTWKNFSWKPKGTVAFILDKK